MSASPISYSPIFWRELFGAKENFWVETDLRDGYPEIAMVSAERRSKDKWKFSRDGPSCHPQHPLTLESCQHLTTSQQGLSVLNTGKLWHTQVTTMGQRSDLQFPDTGVHVRRVGHQGNSFIL